MQRDRLDIFDLTLSERLQLQRASERLTIYDQRVRDASLASNPHRSVTGIMRTA